MKISVCIATYNGDKNIEIQLNSIIKQLNIYDEIIIVDDYSIDDTVKIIESFNDSRIKIFRNQINMGHVFSFNRAIELSSNELIFLSDQDDIWLENRVEIMKYMISSCNASLLTSNSIFINSTGVKINFNIEGVSSQNSTKYFKNIFDIFKGKTNYYGCTMAFKSSFKNIIIPIPSYVESHDLWIGMAANLLKSNLHCNEATLERRIHGNNASVINRNLFLKFKSRLVFIRSLIELKFRIINNK